MATVTKTFTLTASSGTLKTRMLSWLNSNVIGKGSMVMQQLLGQSGDISSVQQTFNLTGKWVAGLGGNYYNNDASQPATPGSAYAINTANANAALINYWNQGGMVLLSGFNWPNPSPPNYGPADPNYGGSLGFFNDLVTPGTQTYNNWLTILDDVAVGIQQLVNAGVCVFFRPLHESNQANLGGSFFWWWGALSDSQFAQLWQITWNYYNTRYNFQNNLIWVWACNGPDSQPARYPGSAYVDVVGFDYYTPTPNDGSAAPFFNSFTSLNKPIGWCEWGGNTDGSQDENQIVAALKNLPNCFYWEQWSSGWVVSNTQNTYNAINDPWVLTRDKLTGRPS